MSRHAFLDATCSIGQAIMDLGQVHAMLVSDNTDKPTQGVHPMTNPREGTLLWRTLYDGHTPDMGEVGLESIQVGCIYMFSQTQ